MPKHLNGSRLLNWFRYYQYKPRYTIWRGEANLLIGLVPLFAVLFWWGALASGRAALTGGCAVCGTTAWEEAGWALALLVGAVAMTAWIVTHLRRPLLGTPDAPGLTAGTGRFETTRYGYDAAEVDRFWTNIDRRSNEEHRGARFGTSRPGYTMEHVDEELDMRIREHRQKGSRNASD